MSLNDKDVTLNPAKGVDIHPGIANPTKSSNNSDPLAANFVTDPTTTESGAGASENFRGGRDAKAALRAGAGVAEARPGIIESSKIEPLDDTSAAANME